MKGKAERAAARLSRRSRPLLVITGLMLGLAILASGFHAGRFLVNLTPSAPLGLWHIEFLDRAVQRGDIVFVCPPSGAAMAEAWRRGYLRSGLCGGGFAPLIKLVAGVPGETVVIDKVVRIDGRLLTGSVLLQKDSRGRPISAHGGGRIPIGSIYLHSAYRGSFDSRYFGPVAADNVLGLAREVLTFDLR